MYILKIINYTKYFQFRVDQEFRWILTELHSESFFGYNTKVHVRFKMKIYNPALFCAQIKCETST